MLTELRLTNFRNISASAISPASGVNLIVGENGSGKTSLLEAVYLLAMGRSFRSRNLKHLIQHGYEYCQVFGRIDRAIPLGVQLGGTAGVKIRLNNAPLKKLSELVLHLPLQYIPANCHQFFEQGPKFRRKVVDWGLFHVEQDFLFHWQNYRKVLQQRNAALRSKKSHKEVSLWDRQLISYGLRLTQYREAYLKEVLQLFQYWFAQICNDYKSADFELRYMPGWPKNTELSAALQNNIDRDRMLGYSRNGPHAADWSIKIDGADPAELLSRGQQKLFYLAISFAQLSLLTKKKRQQKSILLIDDITSELDISHQQLVLAAIKDINIQTFITTTADDLLSLLAVQGDDAVFHVKQGEVTARHQSVLSTSSDT